MIECPICKGKGHYSDQVQWSDGLGTVEKTCSLCNGKGQLNYISLESCIQDLVGKESRAKALAHNMRKCWLIYESIQKTGGPRRDLPEASRPSPFIETWEKHLNNYSEEIEHLK